jgi:hypothetical protein
MACINPAIRGSCPGDKYFSSLKSSDIPLYVNDKLFEVKSSSEATRALIGILLDIFLPKIIPDDHNGDDAKKNQAVDHSRGERGLKGYIELISGGWIDAGVCRPGV